MLARPDRHIIIAQAIICVIMICTAAFANFPRPVPVLFVAAAVGSANAAFELMRTFGSALLGGVAAASIAIAAVPFVTCSTARFTQVFECSNDAPTWHLTGAVIAAGLSGASLVLARFATHTTEQARLERIERGLAELQHQLLGDAIDPADRAEPAGRTDQDEY